MDFDGTHVRLFGEPILVYVVVNIVRRTTGFFHFGLVLAISLAVAAGEWAYYGGRAADTVELIGWFLQTTLLIAFAAVGINEGLANGQWRGRAWYGSWFRRPTDPEAA